MRSFYSFLLRASTALLLALAAPCSAIGVFRQDMCDPSNCPTLYDPICATNGGSYMNLCQLAAAHCRNASFVVEAHAGECVRSPPRKKPLFMLIGDSITQMGFDPNLKGWGLRLAYDYLRQIDVMNRGYGGFNTKWFIEFAMPELLADLTKYEPTLITLWLGTNDGVVSGPQHVPIEQYRFNLKFLIDKIQHAAPQAKLLLIAPPPVADEPHSAAIKEHVGIVLEIASLLHLEVLNLYEYFMTNYPDAAVRNAMLIDGIHFKVEGQGALYDAIRPKIASMLPASVLNNWQTPSYDEVYSYA